MAIVAANWPNEQPTVSRIDAAARWSKTKQKAARSVNGFIGWREKKSAKLTTNTVTRFDATSRWSFK